MGFISSITGSLGNKLGFLKEQDPSTLPICPPISETKSILPEECEFFVKEKKISTSGEDYDVYFEKDKPFLKVRGSTLSHIPGVDEIKIYLFEVEGDEEPKQIAKLKRKNGGIVLYRDTEAYFDSEKICWIYQVDGDHFNVYTDEEKENLIYSFSGEFVGRDILMKNTDDEPVAKIDKRTITESKIMECAADAAGYDVGCAGLDDVQSYDVTIAKGMDVVLVLACTIAIDEQFDEVRQAKRMAEEDE